VKRVSNQSINRKGFLQIAATTGGAAALALFLESCSKAGIATESPVPPTIQANPPTLAPTTEPAPATATATESPSETPPQPSSTAQAPANDGKARVAFVKTNDRADGVRRAIALLGANPISGKQVFLKPNFNSADPAPGSTHPDVLRALVTALQELGAVKITVGDRSGMGDTRQVMEQLGVFQMAQEHGFETVVFDELPPEGWELIQPPGSHWSKGFYFPRTCREAGAVVQTCCLKTHRFGGHFTLSLKNSVGLAAQRLPGESYNYMNELHSSAHQRRMIAEINAAYAPALIVMDGVEAFISGGPDVGERVSPGVVLAATDRIALDAVGVALLRHFGCRTEAANGKIFEQEQIARAVELGLGIDQPALIEFLTDDQESAAYSQQIQQVLLAG
jgi:uncharacterized protein (DUF362 family)